MTKEELMTQMFKDLGVQFWDFPSPWLHEMVERLIAAGWYK